MKMKYWGMAVLLLGAGMMTAPAQQRLSLDDCRQMAIAGSKALNQARTKVEMAGYDRKIALANYFPEISATGGYVYNNRNLSLISKDASDALTGTGTKWQGAWSDKLTEILSDPSVAEVVASSEQLQRIVTQLQGVDIATPMPSPSTSSRCWAGPLPSSSRSSWVVKSSIPIRWRLWPKNWPRINMKWNMPISSVM